jgi:hypothetical protein
MPNEINSIDGSINRPDDDDILTVITTNVTAPITAS